MAILVYETPTFRDYADTLALKLHRFTGDPSYGDLYPGYEEFSEWVEENTGRDKGIDRFYTESGLVPALNEIAKAGTLRGEPRNVDATVRPQDGFTEAVARYIARHGGINHGYYGGICTSQVDIFDRSRIAVSQFISYTFVKEFCGTMGEDDVVDAFSAWAKLPDGTEHILYASGTVKEMFAEILPSNIVIREVAL